jgi:HPt (histidine-containing phosphotransfer) domain-containing protein
LEKGVPSIPEVVPEHIATLDSTQREHATRFLNVDLTLTRLSGDELLLAEIARVFIRTAPKLLAAVRMGFSANDMERVYNEAHSLKGAVAAFEAPEVYNAVAAVQTHALKYDTGAAAVGFETVQSLVGHLVAELSSVAQREALT